MHVEWLTSFIILLLLANKETARYMRIFFAGVEWSGHFCWCTQRLLFSDSNVMITDLWMKTESISRGSPVFSQWMVGPLTSMAEPLEEAWLLIPKQQQHISTVTLAAESATSWWWDINHLRSLPSWWAGWWSFQSLVFGFSAVDDSCSVDLIAGLYGGRRCSWGCMYWSNVWWGGAACHVPRWTQHQPTWSIDHDLI